jgi:hypothetical protein
MRRINMIYLKFKRFYDFFGAFIGLIMGLFVGVLIPAIRGTLYTVEDSKEFEISSFYLRMKIRTQLTLNNFLNYIGFSKKINF